MQRPISRRKSLERIAYILGGLGLASCGSNPLSPAQSSRLISRDQLDEAIRKILSHSSYLNPIQRMEVESALSSIKAKRAAKPIAKTSGDYYWVKSTEETTPDFDDNRIIDLEDFFLFANAFNSNNPNFDLDKDGKVYFEDFFQFAEAFGKKTNSDLTATKPTTSRVNQVELMNNPRTIDLSSYITDPIYHDPISFSIVSANGLVAKLKENEKGELSVIEYRPRGTFNKTDNGLAEIVYRADKEGAFAEEKLEVEVERDDRGMLLYNEATENTYGRKWSIPPSEIYIYIGRAKEKNDPIDPKLWTGTKPTQEQINMAVLATKKLHELTSGFFPKEPNIKIGDDIEKLYTDKDIIIWYWDNTIPFTGATGVYNNGNKIEAVSIQVKTNSTLPVYLHEIGDHGIGLDHPNSFSGAETIFYPDLSKNLQDFSDLDRFVATAYYDH